MRAGSSLDARSGSVASATSSSSTSAQRHRAPGRDVVRAGRDGRVEQRRYARHTSRTSMRSRLRTEVADEHRSAARSSSSAICAAHEPTANRSSCPGPLCCERPRDDDVEPGARGLLGGQLGGGLRRGVRRSGPERSRLRSRDLVGLAVDLSRRDHEHARTGCMRAHRVEEVHGAERVHAPRLARIRPRGGNRRGRSEMDDAVGARRSKACARASASVTSASSAIARAPRWASR